MLYQQTREGKCFFGVFQHQRILFQVAVALGYIHDRKGIVGIVGGIFLVDCQSFFHTGILLFGRKQGDGMFYHITECSANVGRFDSLLAQLKSDLKTVFTSSICCNRTGSIHQSHVRLDILGSILFCLELDHISFSIQIGTQALPNGLGQGSIRNVLVTEGIGISVFICDDTRVIRPIQSGNHAVEALRLNRLGGRIGDVVRVLRFFCCLLLGQPIQHFLLHILVRIQSRQHRQCSLRLLFCRKANALGRESLSNDTLELIFHTRRKAFVEDAEARNIIALDHTASQNNCHILN